MKKANAILEYGIIIVIVMLAVAGMHYFLKRHIAGRIKDETDSIVGGQLGLEWPEITASTQHVESSYDRQEAPGPNIQIESEQDVGYVTVGMPIPQIPIPGGLPVFKKAARSVQDAAVAAPDVMYPRLYYAVWTDPNPGHPD